LRVSIAERLWLWEFDERWEWEREPCGNGGAQGGDARAEQRCEQRLRIEARCRTPRRLKLQRCFAQQCWSVGLALNNGPTGKKLVTHHSANRAACSAAASAS
jgi:hypothetical protein